MGDYMSKDSINDGFKPILEEYNPGISSRKYKQLLCNENRVLKRWLDVLYYMYKMGGQATCTQIAKKYGVDAQHCNANAKNIASAVIKYTNCPIYEDKKLGGNWCVLFYGKYADSEEDGYFKWKLREPLKEAIKELDKEGYFDFIENKNDVMGKTMLKKQFKLVIKADSVISEDKKISEGDYSAGDNYKPVNAYFESAEHKVVYRELVKYESPISNQTLPRIACQVFEKNIEALSDYEREDFPICRYRPQDKLYKGIYLSEEEFRKHSKSFEMGNYKRENGPQFFFYSWSIFSTIVFVQECLKRFAKQGDQFVLEYEYKQDKNNDEKIEEEVNKRVDEYQNPYSKVILKSKNVIFRGAPGTGKTYLAKQIAADIITNGQINDFAELSDEQKEQVEFVQFHPNYDYSDFVEGLRPVLKDDGTMGFELKDGIFKAFVNRAKKNLENSKKSEEEQKRDLSVDLVMQEFFDEIESEEKIFRNIKGGEFKVTDVDDKHIYVSILKDDVKENINLNIDELRKMVESNRRFERVIDVTRFFKKQFATQGYSYLLTLCNAILDRGSSSSNNEFVQEELKKYIFIIDEINRGEISKILGELFYSIDPGYRGKSGMVDTQYQNMHSDLEEKFYIPENVYIIGTMNDIDRSVDSFDFAMRRRFRFIEVKAKETQHMLISLEQKDEAIKRMDALNEVIAKTPELNENYQIGASYFLKLKNGIGFDELWTDYLCQLLQDYVRGLYDEDELMSKFAKAYGYEVDENGDEDEDRG